MVTKRLYRSRKERILGGVSGGLAEYFDVDVTLVRLAWILFALAAGSGVLAYILAWIIIPERPRRRRRDLSAGAQADEDGEMIEIRPGDEDYDDEKEVRVPVEDGDDYEREPSGSGGQSGYWLFGLILVFVGGFFLVGNIFPWFRLVHLWPALLILAGVLVIAGAFRR